MGGPLGRDDLDELGDSAAGTDDPAAVAAQLVDAATSGRLADPADAGHAYLLAAELQERADDLAGAAALAERALAAYRDAGRRESAHLRTYHPRLLLQLGREDEALAALAHLRPQMITDAAVAAAVPEALEAGGRAELALQWLTEALAELGPGGAGTGVADQLAAARDRIRAGVEDGATPPYDDRDDDSWDDDSWDNLGNLGNLGEVDEVGDAGGRFADAPTEAVLLVWPQAAYEEVDQRWPEVLEPTGVECWDEYRRYCQALIANWPAGSPLYQVTGDAAEFAEWLAEQGADPLGGNLVTLAREYGYHLADQIDPVELPPSRDDPCWCGSGVDYAGCCRSLSR